MNYLDKEKTQQVKCCPGCGASATNLVEMVVWKARSTDLQDQENSADITEYQCRSVICGMAFWA